MTIGDTAVTSKGTKVRTAMLHARVALLEQDPKRERLYLESVMTDAPEYAGLVAEQVLANYRAAGRKRRGWTCCSASTRGTPRWICSM